MRHGYMLLWVGWQFDPTRPGLLRLYPPVASENARPIPGLVRSDFVVAEKAYDQNLCDRDHLAYPVADPGDPSNTLTVRDTPLGARRTIPRAEWSFARLENSKPVSDRRRVYMASGFEPKKIAAEKQNGVARCLAAAFASGQLRDDAEYRWGRAGVGS